MQTYRYGQAQVKHLQLRTSHWTHCAKTLPTARTRRPPHETVMGMATRITWDFAPVTGRKLRSHCPTRARGTRRRKQSWACANESPEPPHLSQDAESQATADNAHEAVRAERHTVAAQTWPPHITPHMVFDDNMRRRIHAPGIMQAAADAAFIAHCVR